MESPSTPISDMRWLTLRVQRTIWADWSLHLSEAQNTPWGTCCWTEAKEYDQGDAPDLSKINLSPTKYRGDDLLVEDEHYAVVYNPTVGDTYDVMRKVSAEEIKDNIIRYGLPEDATDDVTEVAKQMEKEEVIAQEEEQHYHRGR